jgi:DegV family protein with EDD domain
MAHQIALVTDSTCDLPQEWRNQYEISVVPLTIIFGDQQYLDGVDMTAEQFYERLPKEKNHPSTSQPTPGAFLDVYNQIAATGAGQILTITLSHGMSGTYESAQQAAQDFKIPVHVMDGKNNSMGLGWQVMAAARVREGGGGLQEMITAVEKVQKNMVYYVTLDTIEYLSRGGRISDATRFLNSVLRIKPLIYVKPESGTVGASIPARSRKSAIEGLYKEFGRHFSPGMRLRIAVMHNNAEQEAREVLERLRKEFSPLEMVFSIVSPVLGVHTGPGAIAIEGYAES